MEVIRDTNNNDDEQAWSTVKSKRNPKKSKRLKRMQFKTPNLAPIYESVSEDEVYYSSGGSDNEGDVVKKVKDMKSTIIILNSSRITDETGKESKATSNNKTVTANSNQKVLPPESRSISTDLCSISKKLDLLADKGIFITRGRRKPVFKHGDNDDRTCKSGCSHCREYQETVSGFAEYFKVRNSIEKPVLDNFNLQLINNANKWRMDFIRSQTPPTPPLPPQKSSKDASEDNSPVIKSIDDAKNECSSVSDGNNDSKLKIDKTDPVTINPLPLKAEVSATAIAIAAPMKVSDLVPEVDEKRSVKNKKAETCSKLEKNLQDTSLKLQNLYDNLESLRLDSNMYFCKLIDFLDS